MTTRYERIYNVIKEGQPIALDLDDLTHRALAIADERSFWGMREIQQYTAKPKSVVQNWARRHQAGFPYPHQVLAMGSLWDREQVKLWCFEHPDMMGRGSRALLDMLNHG